MTNNNSKKGRYTQLPNKIGLYDNKKGTFIKNNNEVVLSFPFKDTVLEAGMSKEDVGREERFLHLSLDSKDIDTLEEPKVLTNFKYIDKDVEKTLDKNSDIEFFDENGNLKQNLLIKGNNLLALYTLKQKLAGKVKLIYIDPPYNTGNDGFKYNDSFNHSSWLTFMKNRLEVARDLLREDGVIFASLDDKEIHYLKVLMDEIFGRENFVGNIAWESKTKSQNTKDSYNKLQPKVEHILLYTKKDCRRFNLLEKGSKSYPKNDSKGPYREYVLEVMNAEGARGRASMIFEINGILPPEGKQWKLGKEAIDEFIARDDLFIVDGKVVLKKRPEDEKSEITEPFWGFIGKEIGTAESAKKELTELLYPLKHDFDTVKPVNLIKKLIFHASNKNDIVLDFFSGSGTTGHSVFEINKETNEGRKFILIEQMDYINTLTYPRLKRVIDNSKSKDSFVYFELKKYNQEYVDSIVNAKSIRELEEIYTDMRNNAFLKFWFDKSEFEKDENYRNLDLEKRKKALIQILDENQLYLNYADMNDTRHKVSNDEKILTNKFYGEN